MKNQHYVPAGYFRFFSKDGHSINMLLRKSWKLVKTVSISDQASKDYFYGDESAENIHYIFENKYLDIIKKIITKRNIKHLTLVEFSELLQGVAFQKARTLTTRIRRKEALDMLYRSFLEVKLHNDKTLSNEYKILFRDLIKKAEADPKQYQAIEMKLALENSTYLNDLYPVLLNNKTEIPFIFCDNPVVLINPYLKNVTSRGVLGYSTPGIIIILPICDDLTLMLIDKRRYTIFDCESNIITLKNLNDVMSLNKLQIHNSSNAIYFSDYQFSQKIGDLWLSEKKNLFFNNDSLKEYPEYDENGQLKSVLVHNYEPQLPFIPELEFLYYEPCGENEYEFSRRK